MLPLIGYSKKKKEAIDGDVLGTGLEETTN
jgi:hypothetical protein